jgi:hypothetical protein
VFHYSDASYCNGGFLSNIQKRRHGHRYPLEVQGKNLERFLRNEYSKILPRLSYIKIDAEGYDKDIVYSIINLLKEYRPVLVSEVYKRLNFRERNFFYEIIKNSGFMIYKYSFSSGDIEKIDKKEDMMKWKHFDIVAIPEEKS